MEGVAVGEKIKVIIPSDVQFTATSPTCEVVRNPDLNVSDNWRVHSFFMCCHKSRTSSHSTDGNSGKLDYIHCFWV
jgi:hypothetical protein